MLILVSVYVFLNAYLLAARRRGLLEKLVEKCPTYYGSRTYITEFTRAQSSTRAIQSTPPIPLPEDPHQYYAAIYVWVFQVVSFPQVSPPKPRMYLSSPHACHRPRPSHSSRFHHPSNIVVNNTKLLYSSCVLKYIIFHSPERSVRNRVQFSVPCCTLPQ